MVLLKNMLISIGRGLHRLFSLKLSLRVVAILLLMGVGAAWMLTSSNMKKDVGGDLDYDEAVRYIEIKDLIEEYYIDPVSREQLGQSAAAAMVNSLGDRWSSYMTADEYKTFQLSSSNEVSGAGLSTMKQDNAGFQVTMVNLDSPAARAGLNAGMLITAIDDIDVRKLDADEFRTMIRSRLNTKFTITVAGQSDPLEIDCSRGYVSPVSYTIERTGAGNIKVENFAAAMRSSRLLRICFIRTSTSSSSICATIPADSSKSSARRWTISFLRESCSSCATRPAMRKSSPPTTTL